MQFGREPCFQPAAGFSIGLDGAPRDTNFELRSDQSAIFKSWCTGGQAGYKPAEG